MPEHPNSFDARATLKAGDREVTIYRIDALQDSFDVARPRRGSRRRSSSGGP